MMSDFADRILLDGGIDRNYVQPNLKIKAFLVMTGHNLHDRTKIQFFEEKTF